MTTQVQPHRCLSPHSPVSFRVEIDPEDDSFAFALFWSAFLAAILVNPGRIVNMAKTDMSSGIRE